MVKMESDSFIKQNYVWSSVKLRPTYRKDAIVAVLRGIVSANYVLLLKDGSYFMDKSRSGNADRGGKREW